MIDGKLTVRFIAILKVASRIYMGFVFKRLKVVRGYEFLNRPVELRFFHLIRKKVLLNVIWICAKFTGWESLFLVKALPFFKEIYE